MARLSLKVSRLISIGRISYRGVQSSWVFEDFVSLFGRSSSLYPIKMVSPVLMWPLSLESIGKLAAYWEKLAWRGFTVCLRSW